MHPRVKVRTQYPEAIAIPWWSGKRAWIVIPKNQMANEYDIGQGETERRAWQDAAKRIKYVPESR
jgi:hypothetical protein